METLILVLMPLAVTGLGVLTYNYPEESRKLLYPILWLIVIILALSTTSSIIQTNSYEKMKNATIEILNNQKIDNKEIIINQINTASKQMITEADNNLKPYLRYTFISFLVVIILFSLSFFFEKIQNKKNIRNNDNSV